MNAKYTEGPWNVVPNAEGAISIMPDMFRRKNAPLNDPASYGFETGIGHAVAFVEGWTNDEANARLIAAAPDLLACLEWAISQIDPVQSFPEHNSMRSDCLAAIAKARGE